MGETDHKLYLCPKCGEQKLEEAGRGLKCRNCGYEIQPITGLQFAKWAHISKSVWIQIVKVMFSLPRDIAGILLRAIYLVPVILYSFILLAICGYAVWDISHSMVLHPPGLLEVESGGALLSRMVLYIILLLALMDLTEIIVERFLHPIYPELIRDKESDKKKKENTRAYLTTVATISVIFILMHTFYKLFDPDTTVDMPFAVLILACLIGAAAVLIAIGLWKKLDSEND